MTFAHAGLAALGLAAVSIPIIIHLLLRQRRRPIEWAAMRFLLEAYKRQRRKLRLQQLILLATRCLIIALIALALGRLALERAGLLGSGGRDVYLLVDTGMASSARGADGEPAIQSLKNAAADIIGGLGSGDRVGLVAMGAPAREIVVPAAADTAAVTEALGRLQPTDGATDLAGSLERLVARLAAQGADNRRRSLVVVLSELREGSLDLSRAAPRLDNLEDLNISFVALEPSGEGRENVQVLAVEPRRRLIVTGEGNRAGEGEARVTLRRTGDQLADGELSSVRLRVWTAEGGLGPVVAQSSVTWSAGEREASTNIRFDVERVSAAGTGVGDGLSTVALVAEIDRDAVAGDNAWRRPVRVVDAVDVGVVHRRSFGATAEDGAVSLASFDWARLALAPTANAPIETRPIEPDALDLPVLRSLDALMVAEPHLVDDRGWERIGGFAADGGLVVVWPSEVETVHLWTDAFIEALGLEWEIEREPSEWTEEGGRRLRQDPAGAGLLGLLAGELAELLSPVTVDRALVPTSIDGATRTLLSLDDGSPWLIAATVAGRGTVVYLASAPVLEWTDLPARPLMVPLMQEMLRQGMGEGIDALVAMVGGSVRAPAGASRLEGVDVEWTGAADGTGPGPTRAGLLRAVADDGRPRALLALNADAAGGLVRVQDRAALQAWFGSIAAGDTGRVWNGWVGANDADSLLAVERSGSALSVPLLLIALILALLETGMARWFSHATVPAGGAGAKGALA